MTPQSPAEKVAALEARVNFLETFIPQFVAHISKSNTFFDKHEEKEEVLEKVQAVRHLENKARLDEMSVKISRKSLWVAIASFAVTLAALGISALTIYVMVKLANHSMNEMLHIFTTDAPTLARSVLSRY